jgi:ATP-dependent DNA ligase
MAKQSSILLDTLNGPKIVAALQYVAKGNPIFDNRVYDGEFFSKDWNETSSIVKTLTPDHPKRNQLEIRLFDTLGYASASRKECTQILRIRKKVLKHLGSQVGDRTNIKIMPYTVLKIKAMTKFYLKQVAQKKEGAVFKNPQSLYSFKKHDSWLKKKPITESDLQVVDAKVGKGQHSKRLGAMSCKGRIAGKKVTVSVGGGMTTKMRDDFWKLHKKGKLVGSILEIKHEGITSKMSLRFPRVLRLRWDRKTPN